MPIISAHNYGFSFGQLADVIPPSSVFGKLSKNEQQNWMKLAELHGLNAAFNRLMPQDKYAGAYSAELGAMVLEHRVMNGSKAVLGLTRLRYLAPERIDEPPHFICTELNIGKDAPASGYSSLHQFVTGGPWLRELETAANKAPFSRFEAGAVSFQKWLKLQQA